MSRLYERHGEAAVRSFSQFHPTVTLADVMAMAEKSHFLAYLDNLVQSQSEEHRWVATSLLQAQKEEEGLSASCSLWLSPPSRLTFLQSLLDPETLRQDWLQLALTHDAPQLCDTLTPDGQPRYCTLTGPFAHTSNVHVSCQLDEMEIQISMSWFFFILWVLRLKRFTNKTQLTDWLPERHKHTDRRLMFQSATSLTVAAGGALTASPGATAGSWLSSSACLQTCSPNSTWQKLVALMGTWDIEYMYWLFFLIKIILQQDKSGLCVHRYWIGYLHLCSELQCRTEAFSTICQLDDISLLEEPGGERNNKLITGGCAKRNSEIKEGKHRTQIYGIALQLPIKIVSHRDFGVLWKYFVIMRSFREKIS